jgi:hypothetical protein
VAELTKDGRMVVRCFECEHENVLALEGWEQVVCEEPGCDQVLSRPVLELDVSYYKRGSDWSAALKEAEGSVPEALELWAERLQRTATRMNVLAGILRESGLDLKAEGDTHVAWIGGLTSEVEEKIREVVPGIVCDWTVQEGV